MKIGAVEADQRRSEMCLEDVRVELGQRRAVGAAQGSVGPRRGGGEVAKAEATQRLHPVRPDRETSSDGPHLRRRLVDRRLPARLPQRYPRGQATDAGADYGGVFCAVHQGTST